MSLSDDIRDRVVFLAGRAVGVDCPNCEFESRDVELDAVDLTEISCPRCGATILTESQQSELRRSGKL